MLTACPWPSAMQFEHIRWASTQLTAIQTEDHRPSRGDYCEARTKSLSARSHRYRSGSVWIRRSSGRRQPNVCLISKEPHLGENPLRLDKIFRRSSNLADHARQGGGVWCHREMAPVGNRRQGYTMPRSTAMLAENSVRRFAFTPTQQESKGPEGIPQRNEGIAKKKWASPGSRWTLALRWYQTLPGTVYRAIRPQPVGHDPASASLLAMEVTDKGIADA